MDFEQLAVDSIERTGKRVVAGVLRMSDPYIVANAIADGYNKIFRKRKKLELNKRKQDRSKYLLSSNGETIELSITNGSTEKGSLVNMELPSEKEAIRFYQKLRDQQIKKPDISQIIDPASLLWEIHSIKARTHPDDFFHISNGRNRSPVYVDIRRHTQFPSIDNLLTGYMHAAVEDLDIEGVVGGESSGITLATNLGKSLGLPVGWVKKKKKGYKGAPIVEGFSPNEVYGMKILLVEDVAASGYSIGVFSDNLKEAGASLEHCICVFDFKQGAKEKAEERGVHLIALTDREKTFFDKVFAPPISGQNYLDMKEWMVVSDYFSNPKAWHEKMGFKYYE